MAEVIQLNAKRMDYEEARKIVRMCQDDNYLMRNFLKDFTKARNVLERMLDSELYKKLADEERFFASPDTEQKYAEIIGREKMGNASNALSEMINTIKKDFDKRHSNYKTALRIIESYNKTPQLKSEEIN